MAIALALATAVAPAAPDDDAIRVIARKLQFIRVDMKAPRRNGKLVLQRCRVTRPSGDAELDIIPCEVAQACMLDNPETRKELGRCVEERSQARLDAVIARHRAQRTAPP